MKVKSKAQALKRRHMRLRRKVAGTAERPRMSVHMSNAHMYVQFVDDDTGRTLAAMTSLSPELREGSSNADKARKLGELAAARLLEQGIKTVIFDRGGHPYKGRVKVIADAAREAGLSF